MWDDFKIKAESHTVVLQIALKNLFSFLLYSRRRKLNLTYMVIIIFTKKLLITLGHAKN